MVFAAAYPGVDIIQSSETQHDRGGVLVLGHRDGGGGAVASGDGGGAMGAEGREGASAVAELWGNFSFLCCAVTLV